MIENAPDGVAILRWPTIEFVNPAAARLLGFEDPAAAHGQDVRSRLVSAEHDRAARIGTWLGASEVVPAAPHYHCTSADGVERTIEISSIPIEYDGQACTLAFARDITARNRMADQLLEADKLAAVGTLAAGVAHEINNPLGYLMLNLDLLARELPKLDAAPERVTEARERLEDARRGAERVKTIVRDLQTLTRRDEDLRGPVDLALVFESAVQLAQHELRYRARLERHLTATPPVLGNVTRLEQLFVNLLINAAHALEGGDPSHDRIDVTIAQGPGGTVLFELADTGCGMSEEVRRKACEPFFTTKAPGVGTGLGLPICRGIVESMGGQLELESTQGAGTRVRITLQAIAAAEGAGGPVEPDTAPQQPVTSGSVLLVDDDQGVAESLACAIGERHRVSVAHSATQARLALAQSSFDAIVCDLAMPGESGIELYESVRLQQPSLAHRFIFMTGGAVLPQADKFLEDTPNPHIDKPFELGQLSQLLDDMLRSKGSEKTRDSR